MASVGWRSSEGWALRLVDHAEKPKPSLELDLVCAAIWF